MSNLEKQEETVSVGDGRSSQDEQVYRIDPAIEKGLIKKTDLLLMPGLALAYFTHTLDRANLGNAKTDGIEKDLGMAGNQFSLLLVLFYLPYATFNIP
ncbi:hypothetical protein BCR34DRAFT_598584 [Clohesyomyces aquaticus]|uniref:Major facilitator superfamily domain-containing protein n=1 Tax=Clohesyomyces aquaticus TaxID=1231657 RepID=A0A1Y1ZZ65_9PLEO|nr:hypothetical protein BCR34DRAFT_598584 [Clohesyomyces aquaticus]